MGRNRGKIGIIGASGFLGRALAKEANRQDWTVVGFSRSARQAGQPITEWRLSGEHYDFDGLDAVVNLAGDPVDKRWTDARKDQFHRSRVGVTDRVVRSIQGMDKQPQVLLNASGIGIYGDRGDEVLDESSSLGDDFLADLCQQWEAATGPLDDLGLRVLKWRTGVVLGKDGPAWRKMSKAFRFGAGGRFGTGRQWMPWIHVDDLVGGMMHAIAHELSGPINGTAPEPVQNAEFARVLGAALHRPALAHAPAWALKLALGEFAEALLGGQRALPKALLESGYQFRFPSLDSALSDLVQS